MARGEAGLPAKATRNVGAADYRALVKRYSKELRALAPGLLAWWKSGTRRSPAASLDLDLDKRNEFELRWVFGPASHPRVIELHRRYMLELDRLNRESRDPRRPTELLVDALEPALQQLVSGMVLVPVEIAPAGRGKPKQGKAKRRSFPIRQEIAGRTKRLLGYLDGLDGIALGNTPPLGRATAKFRALHARYLTDFERVYDTAVDFFEGPIEGRVGEYGMSRKAAIEDAYDRYFAGPAAAPEFVWLVRHHWLAFDALNRTLPEAQRVSPPHALLGWLEDKALIRMITCLPYWPIGRDADGRWC